MIAARRASGGTFLSRFARPLRSLRLAAALVGTVIGAGFLSGAELVRFFPEQGILPHALVAAGLFFLCFWGLYRLGARCGGTAGVFALFGRAAPLLRGVLLVSSFVMCAGMLAGLEAVAREGLGLDLPIPILSLLALAALYLLSGRGMRALYAVDVALVPMIFALIASRAGGVLHAVQPADPRNAAASLFGVCLYVALNAFLAAPVICDAGAADARAAERAAAADAFGRARGGAGLLGAERAVGGQTCGQGLSVGCGGAAIAAALLGFSIAAVAGSVAGTDAEIPFLAALGGAPARLLFSLVCIGGILTSLFSAYYPLHRAVAGRHARLLRAAVCAAAFLLSAAGLGGLVRFVYPPLGAAGAVFFLLLPWRAFARCRRKGLPAKDEGAFAGGARRAARRGRRRARLPYSLFDEQPLCQRDGRIHPGGQQAENGGGRHHEV